MIYPPLLHRSCPLRAERDSLKIGLKASESEKAELVSALEQAKHTVCGMGSWDVGFEQHGTLGQHRRPCQLRPTMFSTACSAAQGTPLGDAAKKRLPEVMDTLRCAQCCSPLGCPNALAC